jgi:hypothetical protein
MKTISKISSGLYTSEYILKNDSKIYFGFEQLTNDNHTFWQHYEQQCTYLARFCSSMYQNMNKYSDFLLCDSEAYDKIKASIDKKGWTNSVKRPFNGIIGGTAGMNQVLFVPSDLEKKVFVVYASPDPIISSNSNDKIPANSCKTLDEFKIMFKHIIMSFIFITMDEAPSVSHYGIFRNPMYFLDFENKYSNIAMILHGFSATVALSQFEDKVYMINYPIPSMLNIILRECKAKAIHIGTNEDLVRSNLSDEDKQLLEKYPPIYHLGKDGIHKIAKRKVDLKDYPNILPDKYARFGTNDTFNFGGYTFGSLLTVINLKHLCKKFSR